MILFQLSEHEDYDIICYDVEGKVSVPASTGLSSVEVSYRYQVTSTHWSRLQGMHMCIITFYYVLVSRISPCMNVVQVCQTLGWGRHAPAPMLHQLMPTPQN